MANINLLKGKIVASGYNLTEFAKAIDMPYTTFSRRLSSGIVGSDEIEKMARILNLTAEEIKSIFFNEKVTL